MVQFVTRRRLAKAAALALALAGATSAAAEVLILRADGPGASRRYRAGTRVPDNTLFNLRPGDSLVVLARGGTRTFRGSGTFSVVQPATAFVVADGRRVRIQTGTVRQAPREEGVQPTDVWDYDSRENGRICVRADGRTMLWRPRGSGAARVTINAPSGAARSFDWAAGETRAEWPRELPLVEGGVYTLVTDRSRRLIRLNVHMLPPVPAEDTEALSSALLAGRCGSQLDTLIATRVDPTAQVDAELPPTRSRGR